MMEVDIFSDTICPWCYIGKRRLERALKARPQPGLRLNWRAFQLNPEMPQSGMPRQLYLSEKFGGAANAAAVYGQIRQAGETEDIQFQFDKIQTTPNTIDSHRLVRYAAQFGRQEAVVQALFDGYFVHGKDIGDHATLAEIAGAVGMNSKETMDFLQSDIFAAEVRAEDAYARRIGIRGVPCFVFDGQHALSGAHPPEVLFQFFDISNAESSLADSE